MRTATTAALALAIAGTAAPGVAQARNYAVDGHVVAPPTAAGGRVVVPVLLSQRAERRMRLRTGLVRISLSRHRRLSAPSPTGRGKAAIMPSAIRTGDRLKASAPLSRRAVRRLRRRAVPSFRARRARLSNRASALSTDELTSIVAELARQLYLLSDRVDGLASSPATSSRTCSPSSIAPRSASTRSRARSRLSRPRSSSCSTG